MPNKIRAFKTTAEFKDHCFNTNQKETPINPYNTGQTTENNQEGGFIDGFIKVLNQVLRPVLDKMPTIEPPITNVAIGTMTHQLDQFSEAIIKF